MALKVNLTKVLSDLGIEEKIARKLDFLREDPSEDIVVDAEDVEDLPDVMEEAVSSNLMLKRIMYATRIRIGNLETQEGPDTKKVYESVMKCQELIAFHDAFRGLQQEGYPSHHLTEQDLFELGVTQEGLQSLALRMLSASPAKEEDLACSIPEALEGLGLKHYITKFESWDTTVVTRDSYKEFKELLQEKSASFEHPFHMTRIMHRVAVALHVHVESEEPGTTGEKLLQECGLTGKYAELFETHGLSQSDSLLNFMDLEDFHRLGVRKLHAKKIASRLRGTKSSSSSLVQPSIVTPDVKPQVVDNDRFPVTHSGKAIVDMDDLVSELSSSSSMAPSQDLNTQTNTSQTDSVALDSRQSDPPPSTALRNQDDIGAAAQREESHLIPDYDDKTREPCDEASISGEDQVNNEGRISTGIVVDSRAESIEVIHRPLELKGISWGIVDSAKDAGVSEYTPESSMMAILRFFQEKKDGFLGESSDTVAGETHTPECLLGFLEAVAEEFRRRNAMSPYLEQRFKLVAEETINPNQSKRSVFKALRSLREIKKKLIPVDLPRLVNLMNCGSESAGLIKDKDVLLLIGPTGTGKTSVVLFFGGVKQELVKKGGVERLEVTSNIPKHLKSFITSSKHRSETRSINAVPVEWVKPDGSKSTVLLCDTPGSNDTGGPEMDISNAFVTVRAIQECRSVRPVQLLSRLSFGERALGPLEEMVELLRNFVDNFDQNVQAFSFIATRGFKDDNAEDVSAFFHQVLDDAEEVGQLTSSSRAFLEAVINSMDKNKLILKAYSAEGALSPGVMLDRIMSGPLCIDNPRDTFRAFVSPKSMAALREQFSIHSLMIKNALRCQAPDLGLVEQKLTEMYHVQKPLTDHRDVKNLYDRAVGEVQDTRHDQFRILQTHLEKVESTPFSGDGPAFLESINRDLLFMKEALRYLTFLDMSLHEVERKSDLAGQTRDRLKTMATALVKCNESELDLSSFVLSTKKLFLVTNALISDEFHIGSDTEEHFKVTCADAKQTLRDELDRQKALVLDSILQEPSAASADSALLSLQQLVVVSCLMKEVDLDEEEHQRLETSIAEAVTRLCQRGTEVSASLLNQVSRFLDGSTTHESSADFDRHLSSSLEFVERFRRTEVTELLSRFGARPQAVSIAVGACLRRIQECFSNFAPRFASELECVVSSSTSPAPASPELTQLATRSQIADDMFCVFSTTLSPFTFSSRGVVERLAAKYKSQIYNMVEGFSHVKSRLPDEETKDEFFQQLAQMGSLAHAFRESATTLYVDACAMVSDHLHGLSTSVDDHLSTLRSDFSQERLRSILNEQGHLRWLVAKVDVLNNLGDSREDGSLSVSVDLEHGKSIMTSLDSFLIGYAEELANTSDKGAVESNLNEAKELLSLLMLMEQMALNSPSESARDLRAKVDELRSAWQSKAIRDMNSLQEKARRNMDILKAKCMDNEVFSDSSLSEQAKLVIKDGTENLRQVCSTFQLGSEIYEEIETGLTKMQRRNRQDTNWRPSSGQEEIKPRELGDLTPSGGIASTGTGAIALVEHGSGDLGAETKMSPTDQNSFRNSDDLLGSPQQRVSWESEAQAEAAAVSNQECNEVQVVPQEEPSAETLKPNGVACLLMLGLDPSQAGQYQLDDICTAFKRMSRTEHPDRGGDTAKFQDLQESYEFLCNWISPESTILQACRTVLQLPCQLGLRNAGNEMDSIALHIRSAVSVDEKHMSIQALGVSRELISLLKPLDAVLESPLQFTFASLLEEVEAQTRLFAARLENTKERLVLYADTHCYQQFMECCREHPGLVSGLVSELEAILAKNKNESEAAIELALREVEAAVPDAVSKHTFFREIGRNVAVVSGLSNFVAEMWSSQCKATALLDVNRLLQETQRLLPQRILSVGSSVTRESVIDDFDVEKAERTISGMENAATFISDELPEEEKDLADALVKGVEDKRAELSGWASQIQFHYSSGTGSLTIDKMQNPSLRELVEELERCDGSNSGGAPEHRYFESINGLKNEFRLALDSALLQIVERGAEVGSDDLDLLRFLQTNIAVLVPDDMKQQVVDAVEVCMSSIEAADATEKERLAEEVREVEQNERYEENLIKHLRPKVDEYNLYLDRRYYQMAKNVSQVLNQLIRQGIKRYEGLLSDGKPHFVLRKLPTAFNEWKWYSTYAKKQNVWNLYYATEAQDMVSCLDSIEGFLDRLSRTIHSSLHILEKCMRDADKKQLLISCRQLLPLLGACLNPQLGCEEQRSQEYLANSVFPVQLHMRKAWISLFGRDRSPRKCSQRLLEAAIKAAAVTGQVKEETEKGNWKAVLKAVDSFDVAKETVTDLSRMDKTHLPKSFENEIEDAAKCFSGGESPRAFVSEVLSKKKDDICQPWLGQAQLETPVREDKTTYFADLNHKYQRLLDSVAQLKVAVPEVAGFGDACKTTLRQNLLALKQSAEADLSQYPPRNDETHDGFTMKLDIVKAFMANVDEPDLKQEAQSFVHDVEQVLKEKLSKSKDAVVNGFQLNCSDEAAFLQAKRALADTIIANQKVADRLPSVRGFVEKLNDDALNSVLQMENGYHYLYALQTELKQCGDSIGVNIAQAHQAFAGSTIFDFVVKTQKFGVDDVLAQMKEGLDEVASPNSLPDKSKANLKNQYAAFKSQFEEAVHNDFLGLYELSDEDFEIELANKAAEYVKLALKIDQTSCKDIRKLMCHVFAWWCVSYFKQSITTLKGKGASNDAQEIAQFLRQPHAAQVIALFRLFGMDGHPGPPTGTGFLNWGSKNEPDTPIQLNNHLAEILTGQGKSVTLAVASTVLALIGYDVDCACYSEYLTNRDYEQFKSMFDAFGVHDLIRYGTFNSLCEDLLDSSGSLRKVSEEFVLTGSCDHSAKHASKRRRALLIDEVDVFFKEDFHGNVYRPDCIVKPPGFLELAKTAWDLRQRRQRCSVEALKNTNHYSVCAKSLGGRVDIFDELLQTMVSDLYTFESHSYICEKGEIGYKEADGSVSYHARIRFQTMWAYFKENQLGNVSDSVRDNNVGLIFNCGAFSYAEIPLQFDLVIGVTGTLQTLSGPEKHILKDKYNINLGTYVPSVYGKRQLTFSGDSEEDVMLCDTDEDWLLTIKQEIERRITLGGKRNRAILVFFEDSTALDLFRNSHHVSKQDMLSWQVMKETTVDADKPLIIAKAATKGQVTLLTREFGRGTDFYCCDKAVIDAKGVHVIQTFVSDQISEETQIKGRTARQDQEGSYSMVLHTKLLERMKLHRPQIEEMRNQRKLYSRINEKRTEVGQAVNRLRSDFEEEVKNDHDMSLSFATAIQARDLKKIHTFINERNLGVPLPRGSNSRTLLALDATGSMYQLIEGAKVAIQKMFTRAYEVIESELGDPGLLQVQFCAYRNYCCGVDALQASSWETSAPALVDFVQGISAKGGLGNEAIELAFEHALREHENDEIAQVVVLGDAPPNTPEETREHRSRYNYNCTPQVYCQDVRRALLDGGVTIHTFYIESGWDKMDQFISIAGGQDHETGQIDVDNSDAVDTLTDVVTERVLNAYVGGGAAGQRLIDKYRERFCKGYSARR